MDLLLHVVQLGLLYHTFPLSFVQQVSPVADGSEEQLITLQDNEEWNMAEVFKFQY